MFLVESSKKVTLSDSKLRLLNDLLWLMGNIFMDQNAMKHFSFCHESFHRALYLLAERYPLADETWLLVVWNMHALSLELLTSNSKEDSSVFFDFAVLCKARFLESLGNYGYNDSLEKLKIDYLGILKNCLGLI